jgi:uncharacterized damage-inducible protein DinB
MKPEEFRELYQFNSWANRRVLEACSALTCEQFVRDLRSSFPSVRDTLAHILWSEGVWLDRLNGRSPKRHAFATPPAALSEIESAWSPIEGGLLRIVNSLSADDVDRKIEYLNWQGNRYAYSVGNILKHVVNHGSYHRGQVATMLRQLSAKPVSTDFLHYFDFLAGDPEA